MSTSRGRSGGRRAGRAVDRRRRLRTVDETSAGGLVVDHLRLTSALIGRIDRRGRLRWSLPKGHIELGETAEQAAVREVEEETGIIGRVVAPLGTIDFWFVAEDRRVHKTVHHFLLRALGGELCDDDVEVAEVAWVPLDELESRLAYADERRLVRRATEMLADSAWPLRRPDPRGRAQPGSRAGSGGPPAAGLVTALLVTGLFRPGPPLPPAATATVPAPTGSGGLVLEL